MSEVAKMRADFRLEFAVDCYKQTCEDLSAFAGFAHGEFDEILEQWRLDTAIYERDVPPNPAEAEANRWTALSRMFDDESPAGEVEVALRRNNLVLIDWNGGGECVLFYPATTGTGEETLKYTRIRRRVLARFEAIPVHQRRRVVPPLFLYSPVRMSWSDRRGLQPVWYNMSRPEYKAWMYERGYGKLHDVGREERWAWFRENGHVDQLIKEQEEERTSGK